MKRLFLLTALMVCGLAAAAQSTLSVKVPEVVAVDEQFNITFVLEGEDSPSDFKWSPGEDFQLVWGPQTGRSTSVQIINGKRTKSTQATYTYILMPRKTGKFTVPQASVKVKGKEIVSEAAVIEVVSGGSSSASGQGSSQGQGSARQGSSTGISDDDIFMRLELSRTRVVVGEPITATLKLYQRANIAGFEDARFPTFNGFWSQEVEAPTNIEFRRENYNDQIYNSAVLRKYVLIPQQEGTITIDPAELVCLVNVRVSQGGTASIFDGFFDDYRTIRKRVFSQSYTVNVTPLPAGAPASFGGGVGDFSISAALSKDSLATHEAASLTVTIKGRGNVSLLEAPKVSFPPDFEVYDIKTTERTDKASGGTSGSKTYEYPFIPRSHGDFVIPPISYSYYDISKGRYMTLQTPEIPFHVAKGADGAASGTVTAPSVSRHGVKSLGEDIRFIRTKMPQMASKGHFFVGSALFWGLTAASVLIAVLVWAIFRTMAARRADVVGTKTRKATKMALRRLRLAEGYLKQNLYSAFYEELHKALLGFISDKLAIPVADLSKEKISEALSQAGAPEALAGQFVGLVDACEFARYSPDAGHDAMNAHYQEAVNVISSMDSILKGKTSGRKGTAALVGLFLILAAPSVATAAPAAVPADNAAPAAVPADNAVPAALPAEAAAPAAVADQAPTGSGSYIDGLWNSAVAAYSEGRWEDACKSFTAVSDAGLESAAMYCNIGSSWFKSGDYARAVLYYKRALKLDPSYSDARYNLEVVSNFIQDRIDPVPEFVLKTWTKAVCYIWDSDTWAVLFIVFLALTGLMTVVLLLSDRTGWKRTGFYSGLVCLLFAAASLSFSLWQRADYMRSDEAVVMRPVTSAKSSPSEETSTDLFVLHEGTTVKVLDAVGRWNNIELADGRQGWLPSEDLEII